jgi:hypothetical protein
LASRASGRLKYLPVIAVCMLLVPLAGCGGSADHRPGTIPPPTPHAGSGETKLERDFRAFEQQVRGAAERLESADLPDEMNAGRDAVLDAMYHQIADIHQIVAGSRARDADQMRAAMKRLDADEAKAKARAGALAKAASKQEEALSAEGG